MTNSNSDQTSPPTGPNEDFNFDASDSIELNRVGDQNLIDSDDVIERVGGDLDLLNELIEMFLSHSPSLLKKVSEAVDLGDCQELQDSAHALKGAISTYSTKEPYSLAMQLEFIGAAGDIAGAADVFQDLEGSLDRLNGQLHQLASEPLSIVAPLHTITNISTGQGDGQ